MNELDPELLLKTNVIDFDSDVDVLVLGIAWFTNSDQFQIRLNLPETTTIVTKRSTLSKLSRVFDPLGFLAPATICEKLLLQNLWKLQLSWDEPIPNDLQLLYQNIADLFIDRRYCEHLNHEFVQLFGFADASDKAYSAVVYSRCSEENNVRSYIISAKTRVAPLGEITIPKLELCAALLLSELTDKISRILNISKDNVKCFSDSTIVLSWIKKSPCELKTFVSNRVKRIANYVPVNAWSYVKSKENPADLATRGVKIKECGSDFRLKGPEWLCDDSCNLSEFINIDNLIVADDRLPELKKSKLFCGLTEQGHNNVLYILNRFSHYSKMLRVIAYIFRFYNNCKTINRCYTDLFVPEIDNAFCVIIRLIQKTYFDKELFDLKCKNRTSRKSKIFSFNPFVDEKGILRVGGRLMNSDYSFDRKHPILIPTNCNFAITYIRYVHDRFCHASPSFILTFVNQKFRFVGVRNN